MGDKEYVRSVMAMADPGTGMLSPGDAMRVLQWNGYTWNDYVLGDSRGLADWPCGSRDPKHILDFLGYRDL